MRKRVGLLAGLLVLVLGSGVVAQSPSPEPPPWFGGRVEMPEYGFAITVPDGMVAFSSSSDLEEQARQAAAFLDPRTSGEFIGGLTDSLRASFAGGGQLLMLGGATASCTVGVTAGGPVEPEHAANVTWADLVLALSSGAVAQEPSPEPPPWFGGRVEMLEHGFAVTLPEGAFAFDLTGDLFEQALSVMTPLNPEASEDALEDAARAWSDLLQQRMRGQLMVGSSQSACSFAVGPALEEDIDSVAARFYDRQSNNESVIHVEPPTFVDLASGPAHLLTYGRTGEEVALYLGKVANSAFNISCYGPERPEDDWLSIAGTLEFLPAEE